MQLKPVTPTAKAPAANFTGDVYVNPIYRGEDPSRMIVSLVRFTPGARTNWHSHAVGQTLHVTEGSAWSSPATAPSSGCVPAIPSGRRPARNTGTAAPTATSCATWPCSKAPATARRHHLAGTRHRRGVSTGQQTLTKRRPRSGSYRVAGGNQGIPLSI